jgi:hypothetical protein
MIRIEIIANHSVEENILEVLAEAQVAKHYTRYPKVMGVGRSGPKMGDAIWPEENFALVIWCEDEEAQTIERAVASVKERFPEEGIKLFVLRSGDGRPREALPVPENKPELPDPGDIEGLLGLTGLE